MFYIYNFTINNTFSFLGICVSGISRADNPGAVQLGIGMRRNNRSFDGEVEVVLAHAKPGDGDSAGHTRHSQSAAFRVLRVEYRSAKVSHGRTKQWKSRDLSRRGSLEDAPHRRKIPTREI